MLNDMHVPFEMNALSAHRTPEAVEEFAKNARNRGIKVIIAAAGMAAALPGVIAANTTLPVIGVPVKRFRARWCRRTLFYHPDASGHSCGNGCYKRSDECRYPCHSDVGIE